MGVVHTVGVRPAGPWGVLRPVLGRGVTPGELEDALGAESDGSGHAVNSCVATPDHHHTLALHIVGRGVGILQAHLAVQVLLLRVCQEVHGLHNVLQVTAVRVAHVTPHGRSGGHDDCIVLAAKAVQGHVLAHLRVALEGDALLLHELDAAKDLVDLVQLHRGDAVHQQTSGTVSPLNNLHEVPRTVQLLRRSEASRSRADDGDAPARALERRLGLHPTLAEAILDDGQLGGLNRDRLLVDAQNAGFLARRRAGGACELGEVVGIKQTLEGTLPLALMYQLIPSGDAVAQRTATSTLIGAVACGSSAVHAPSRLCLHPIVPLLALLGLGRIDLLGS